MTQQQIKKIRILDLFAGTQSVRKALEKDYEIEYIGLDIYSPEQQNTIFDLTQNDIVEKLVEILPKDGKPDFIGASPVCNKFSKVISGKNGNFYFVLENEKIRPREKNEMFGIQEHMKKRFIENDNKSEALLALKMYDNMKKIINHFNVPFAIENPSTALSQFILNKYIKNETAYCMYGFNYKKPTAIYSYKELQLQKCNHKIHERALTNTKNQPKNKTLSYQERSKVPPLLIKEIFIQLFEKEGK